MTDDRATWLADRQAIPYSIGASDVARLQSGDFGGPWSVWAEHEGRRRPDRAAFAGGHGAEPWVAGWALDQLGATATRCGWSAPWVERDPEAPWAACSPDLLAERQGRRLVVELKTAHGPTDWPAPGLVAPGQLPHGYGWQVAWQLGVTGADEGWLAAWLGAGAHLWRLYQVAVDRPAYFRLRAEVGRWRETHLVEGVEPATEDAEGRLAHARARAQPAPLVELAPGTPTQAQLAGRWLAAAEAEGAAAYQRAQAEADLLRACPSGARFAEGAVVVGTGGRPKWVAGRRGDGNKRR